MFVLTSIPSKGLPAFGVSDKFEHALAYFVLTVLFAWYILVKNNFSWNIKSKSLFVIVVISLYSFFDEIHQILIPGRYFDWLDLLANKIGILAGFLFSRFIYKMAADNFKNDGTAV